GAREEQREQALGEVERLRRENGEDLVERRALGLARHRTRGRLLVAAKSVRVREAADGLRRARELVAVVEVERREDLLERRERDAFAHVPLAEARERDLA